MTRTKKGHSPSSHPRHRITVRSSQRSVLLTRTFCYCTVHKNTFSFGQASHYFQVTSEPLNLTFRATRITGQLEQNTAQLARGILRIATATPPPPHRSLEGRPRTCTSSIFGTFQGKPPRTKRFNHQDRWTGQQPTLNSLRKLRSIFLTFKNHL